MVEADDDSFAAAVSGPLPVLVDLWAAGCEPCQDVGPIVEQAAADFAGRLKVVTSNVENTLAAAQRLGVLSVPTLIVMHGGYETARQVGALPSEELVAWLARALRAAA